MTPRYLAAISAATAKKGANPGRGNATEKFSACTFMKIDVVRTEQKDSTRSGWKTFAGFSHWFMAEMSWTYHRCELEWTHLRKTLPPQHKRCTRDRLDGSLIDWCYVDLEEIGERSTITAQEMIAEQSGCMGSDVGSSISFRLHFRITSHPTLHGFLDGRLRVRVHTVRHRSPD